MMQHISGGSCASLLPTLVPMYLICTCSLLYGTGTGIATTEQQNPSTNLNRGMVVALL